MGVDINLIEPIGGVSTAMYDGFRVGEVNGGFVEMNLEYVVTKLAD